jgi:hypothetical protein
MQATIRQMLKKGSPYRSVDPYIPCQRAIGLDMANSPKVAEQMARHVLSTLGRDALLAGAAERPQPDAEVLAILEGRKPEAEQTGAAACRAALQGARA